MLHGSRHRVPRLPERASLSIIRPMSSRLSAGVVVVRSAPAGVAVSACCARIATGTFPRASSSPVRQPLEAARREVREETSITELQLQLGRGPTARPRRTPATRWRATTSRRRPHERITAAGQPASSDGPSTTSGAGSICRGSAAAVSGAPDAHHALGRRDAGATGRRLRHPGALGASGWRLPPVRGDNAPPVLKESHHERTVQCRRIRASADDTQPHPGARTGRARALSALQLHDLRPQPDSDRGLAAQPGGRVAGARVAGWRAHHQPRRPSLAAHRLAARDPQAQRR